MSCEQTRKSDLLLLIGGALLINLLLVALIPMLFKKAGRPPAARIVSPPVFLVPAPPEAPSESSAPAPVSEPETQPPPPLKLPPEPLPVPEINPEIKFSEIRINPRIETSVDLPRQVRPDLPAPAPVPQVRPALPASGFYRVGELDRQPLEMARMQPPYPFRARRRGIEGKVKIRFYITPSGRVEGVHIVKAEPPGYFEKSVLDTVAGWRFKPGMVDGRAVKTLVETTIVFKLDR